MRGRWGAGMCGCGTRYADNNLSKGLDSAIEILDRRYASGEIEKAEYDEKKRALNESQE